jgi:hypothetical protein
MSRTILDLLARVCAGAGLTALAVFPAAAADLSQSHTFTSRTLEVANLIGEIEVEPAAGSAFEVDLDIRGADAARDLVRIEKRSDGLAVVFPLDESRQYRYPAMGRGRSQIGFDDDSWLSSLLGGLTGRSRHIEVSGTGRGLELWVDMTVRVPRGGSLTVDHGVGSIAARGVDGELALDTGSGSVEVVETRGKLSVDTGSGQVVARDVEGVITLDTGSGSVQLERARGDEISVDTGSGSVQITDVDGERLSVDTGSGGIEAERIGADSATLDTGSGSVRLELERMGRGAFEIDTGSGGIQLIVPRDAVAEIGAATGSGGVVIDLQGAEVRHDEQNSASVRLGSGNGARVTLDTGSGSIRISH